MTCDLTLVFLADLVPGDLEAPYPLCEADTSFGPAVFGVSPADDDGLRRVCEDRARGNRSDGLWELAEALNRLDAALYAAKPWHRPALLMLAFDAVGELTDHYESQDVPKPTITARTAAAALVKRIGLHLRDVEEALRDLRAIVDHDLEQAREYES